MPISDDPLSIPGDVVVVPIPYSDRFAEKRRPALVISNEQVNSHGYLWVAMITSARHSRLDHDIVIDDLPMAGLTAPSVIRPIKIANIEPRRVIRRAGRIDPALAERACSTMRRFIGANERKT